MATLPSTPIPSVRVLWRPEQFSFVTNGTFETNTTGWATTAGINAAGTSITRVTTDFHSGTASASVVCTSTDTSGVNFDMGSTRFYAESTYGSMYAAVVWLKRVSGSRRARITLGSEGTSSDRATLTITDLTDQWQPYVIRWLPTGTRTDVQLAVTNGSAEALTFLLDDVAVYLVDAFSQVENGTFETDTAGWSAYLSGSIARSTAEAFGGTACARVTSGATAFGGVSYTLSGRTFKSGRTYRLRVAAKTISGTGTWYIELTDGTTTTDTFFTPGSSFEWQTADVTCAADRTTMTVYIGHVAASSAVMAIDEVEVYEAVDDLGADAGDTTWTRYTDQVGTITVDVENADGRYDPRNSSSVLYGSCSPGKRIWGRATYGGALYPLFYGTLTTIEAAPLGGVHATLLAEDMMGTLGTSEVFVDFAQDDSYRDVRSWIMDSVVSNIPSTIDSPTSAAHESLAHGIEDNTHYRGTDGNVPALQLLEEYNQATQTAHFIKPSVHANIGWVYTTVDRATLTDGSSDFTVDEDFADLTGVRVTHEALENWQEVSWQAYEKLPPPAHSNGFGLVMVARDPATITYFDADDPYLHYINEEYGTDDAHPGPRWKLHNGDIHGPNWKGWKTRRERRKRGEKFPRRKRYYLHPYVPLRMAAGETRRIVLDFAVPVSGFQLLLSDTTDSYIWFDADTGTHTILVDIVEQRPTRLVVDLICITPDVVANFEVYGTPWLPLDDLTETMTDYDSRLLYGAQGGPSLSTAYVASKGSAQGIGAYRNWRYREPRLSPALLGAFQTDGIRVLTADVTDHMTVTSTRWNISTVLFIVTGCRWVVSRGGLDWRSEHQMEELPTHTDWFILDDATKGLDDAVVLAY